MQSSCCGGCSQASVLARSLSWTPVALLQLQLLLLLRRLGWVSIADWSLGRVGPVKGLRVSVLAQKGSSGVCVGSEPVLASSCATPVATAVAPPEAGLGLHCRLEFGPSGRVRGKM
jgi:hypothetical protein